MASVLIVEDDEAIRTALSEALGRRGHSVSQAATGLSGLKLAMGHKPDVVVLDLGLPDIDGKDLLSMLRKVSPVPVLVATARDDEREIVRLLDIGADDYVIKPFSAEQIDARVRAIMRRAVPEESSTDAEIVIGNLRVSPAAREVRLDDQEVTFSRKEFDILLYLASRVGQVVSKQELATAVWHQPFVGMDGTVDTHLSWIRNKLGESASNPRLLHTIRGVGVKIVQPE